MAVLWPLSRCRTGLRCKKNLWRRAWPGSGRNTVNFLFAWNGQKLRAKPEMVKWGCGVMRSLYRRGSGGGWKNDMPIKSVNIGKHRSISLKNCLSRQSEVYEHKAFTTSRLHITLRKECICQARKTAGYPYPKFVSTLGSAMTPFTNG